MLRLSSVSTLSPSAVSSGLNCLSNGSTFGKINLLYQKKEILPVDNSTNFVGDRHQNHGPVEKIHLAGDGILEDELR